MNGFSSPVDLRPDHLEIVQDILREHLPMDVKVWVFGSRANWTTKDSSDLDLAVEGAARLDNKAMSELEMAFEESDLPYFVDVVDLNTVGDAFKQIVEEQRTPFPTDGDDTKRTATEEWREVTLGEICSKIGSGATPRGGKEVYLDNGPYALIRSQNIYNSGFVHGGLAFISDDHAEALRNVEVLPEDVLLNITGDSVARICQVDGSVLPARVNQHVAIIRPDPDILDPGYLRYYLVMPEVQATLLSWAGSGGTRNALTKKMIESFSVRAPKHTEEQRAIAHVLGTLDDKIELNRRMNETLEAMARALFKSWFVDFEPVRAKMEGRWRRGESLPGLPADLYDLFPERLAPSELGEIPEGWEVRRLGECYNLTMGQSPPGKTYNDDGEGMPFFQGRTDFGFRYPANRRYCTAPKRLAEAHDTLVSVRAPVGDINMAWEECCIGRGVSALRHKSGSVSFTYCSMRALQPALREYEQTGTVFGAINKNQFEALPIVEPPRYLVDAFETVALDWDKQIRLNVSESRSLTAQRDALLPRLVSGEVRVWVGSYGSQSIF